MTLSNVYSQLRTLSQTSDSYKTYETQHSQNSVPHLPSTKHILAIISFQLAATLLSKSSGQKIWVILDSSFPIPTANLSVNYCLCFKNHPESDYSHHLYSYPPWSKPPSCLFQVATTISKLISLTLSSVFQHGNVIKPFAIFHFTIARLSLRVEAKGLTLHSPTSSLTTLAVTINVPATWTSLAFPKYTSHNSALQRLHWLFLCVEHSPSRSDILRCTLPLHPGINSQDCRFTTEEPISFLKGGP